MSQDEHCSIQINGVAHEAKLGESILQVARRAGVTIPTLCHDDRLDPTAACRACLIEIEGQRKLQPACAWRVTPDLRVDTESDRIQRHRKLLVALYDADHPRDEHQRPAERGGGNVLRAWASTIEKPLTLPAIDAPRVGRPDDANPYIKFDPEACILCARCTRYCDEVEGVNAIALSNKGPETTIATVAGRGLLDTSCELCGGCIDTCPTGALIEAKVPGVFDSSNDNSKKVRTTCNYCGVGCQMDLNVDSTLPGGRVTKVTSPPPGETVNDGNLCVKGRFAYDFIHHPDRLTHPLVRDAKGQLQETSWEKALAHVAQGLRRVQDRHGADALGFVSSSRCTGEENYLLQKLARAAFGTNNCHQCAAT